MNHRSFFPLLLLTTLAVSTPAHAQNSPVTVAATVASKSDSRSAIQKARPEALELAKKNAWFVYKNRPEFQRLVYNFGREQDQEIVSLLAELCTEPVDLDQAYNKKLGQLTFRFRFQCEQQALVREVGRVSRKAGLASGGPNANQPRARLSGFFIAIKDDRVEEFDATVTKSVQASLGNSLRQQASGSASSEKKIKGAIKTKETYGESSGEISEGFAVKGRVQESGSAESQFSFDENKTERLETQTSGSTVSQSAKVTRSITQAQELELTLGQYLTREGFQLFPYGSVESRCGSVPSQQIQEEIRALPSDLPLALRNATRDKVLQATNSCTALPRIQYYIEGYAKIGVPRKDPSTGNVRVTVNVSQTIYDVMTTAISSSTPETQVYGVGLTEVEATSKALAEAAELVGQTTVSNLASLGI